MPKTNSFTLNFFFYFVAPSPAASTMELQYFLWGQFPAAGFVEATSAPELIQIPKFSRQPVDKSKHGCLSLVKYTTVITALRRDCALGAESGLENLREKNGKHKGAAIFPLVYWPKRLRSISCL